VARILRVLNYFIRVGSGSPEGHASRDEVNQLFWEVTESQELNFSETEKKCFFLHSENKRFIILN
jgi:hypothetical protein